MTETIASSLSAVRHVFVRDLVMTASIGIYPHEHTASQRVRINVDLGVDDEAERAGLSVGADDLGRVVDYEKVVVKVRAVVSAGHTKLVETMAERIAEICLADQRVRTARIRVEKLDVFDDVASVGVEVERHSKNSSTR
jgi:dihydroneopterin aldolase